MPTIETEEQVPLTDIAAPRIETNGKLPEDSFRNEDYRGEVAAAVAKLKGVTHADGETPDQEDKPAGERARDENGRFAAKPAEGQDAPAETKESTTEDDKDAQRAEPASKPAGAPPPGWSAASKAAFSELPPSIQEDVIKREQEISNGFRQVSERMRPLAAVDEVLAPRREFFAQHGFASDAQVVSHLLSYSDAMERDPAGTLKTLADAYRVDLRKLSGVSAPQPGPDDPQVLPEFSELRQHNSALEDRLRSIEAAFIAQQRQAEAVRAQEERLHAEKIASEVAAFAADKPHFEKVRPLMAGLLQAGAAKDIDDAYQMAVFADPATRAAVQAEEEAKRKATEEAKKRQAAEKAKAAAVSVRPSPASSSQPAPKASGGGAYVDDVRADVLAAFRKAQARV